MTDHYSLKRRDFLWAAAGFSGSVIASQLPFQSAEAAAISITGAGASFPAPLYVRWFTDFAKASGNQIQINYQSIGSGSGVKQFMQGATFFGASDVAMTDQEMSGVSGGVVLLPMTAGSVVVAYNMPNMNLKLSRQQLADVFLGKITNWKDLGGSDQKISVVRRSDGSGTTAVFTKYLSAVSSEWESKVGNGKSVQWPAGIGAKGNEGVTAQIQQNKGAIGYLEYGYAKKNNVGMAELENKAKKFVSPTPQNTSATLSKIQLPSNLRAFIVDPSDAGAYPIVTYTWVLMKQKYGIQDKPKVAAMKRALKWCLEPAQQNVAPDLGYIALPSNVVGKVKSAIDSIS
ncbi:MAG: phosphate ABC transporter substrate-binding protein PstS [Microcystaceae cyanobacterium]